MNVINNPRIPSPEYRTSDINSGPINIGEIKTISTPAPSLIISGKALMYSRLFNTNDFSKEINIEKRTGSSDIDNISYFEYLTQEDRNTIESSYEYAAKNNIDLKYVDTFAADLGAFRKYGSIPIGDIYTSDGRKITNDFTASDKVVANRILSSSEINNTKIDRDFLNRILDSSSPAHATNLEFLEHLVSVFSSNGSKTSTDRFINFPGAPNKFITKIADEVNPKFAIEEPDLIKINGKGYIKNPKKYSISNKDYFNSIDLNIASKYFDATIKSPINGLLTDQPSHNKTSNSLGQKIWNILVGQ